MVGRAVGPYYRDLARHWARGLTCFILGHDPVKVVGKTHVDSVAIVSPGVIAGALRIDESHRYCKRCGAREHVTDGRARWVA